MRLEIVSVEPAFKLDKETQEKKEELVVVTFTGLMSIKDFEVLKKKTTMWGVDVAVKPGK